MKLPALTLAVSAILLGGCDLISQRLGIEDPQQKEAKADAEGRAVGSACRQSGRAIEDCYSLYRWLPKASIFAGWREMNDYMQANNLGIVEPKLPPTPGPEERKKKARAISGEGDGNNKPEEKKLAEPGASPDATVAAKIDESAKAKGEAGSEKHAEPKAESASGSKK